MKKGLIIAITISLLAIAGVGYWYFFARNGASPTSTEETSNGNGSFVGSIADALKIGTAVKCTWSFEGESAIFYIKDQKYSAEITPKEGSKTSYIQRDNCTYIWQEGEAQGMKMCYTPAEGEEDYDFSDRAAADEENAEALGAQYNCQSTVITDAQFTLPSGIEFLDFGQYLQQSTP